MVGFGLAKVLSLFPCIGLHRVGRGPCTKYYRRPRARSLIRLFNRFQEQMISLHEYQPNDDNTCAGERARQEKDLAGDLSWSWLPRAWEVRRTMSQR